MFNPATLATFVESVRWADAALNSMTLDSNGIFGTLETSSSYGRADKFDGDCDPFLAAVKDSNIMALSLKNTGIGPVTLRKLATSLPAALNEVAPFA